MIPQFAKLAVTKGSHTTQSLAILLSDKRNVYLFTKRTKMLVEPLFVIVNKTNTITRNESFVHQQQNENYTMG